MLPKIYFLLHVTGTPSCCADCDSLKGAVVGGKGVLSDLLLFKVFLVSRGGFAYAFDDSLSRLHSMITPGMIPG